MQARREGLRAGGCTQCLIAIVQRSIAAGTPLRWMRLRPMAVARQVWLLVEDTFEGFIADEALSRGASIAYYTLFSLAPVLLVVIAVAGLSFGREAAQGAIVQQLRLLMGAKTAEALQAMIESAARPREGVWASIIGIVV